MASITACRLVCGIFLLVVATTSEAKVSTSDHGKVVGCYWGTWSVYREGDGMFDVSNFDANLCTHGFYGFADMSNSTYELVAYDPWYDMAAEDCGPQGSTECHFDGYRRFTQLRETHPNFTPLLSVGGWNAGSAKFSEMANDPAKKKIFINSVVPFLKKFGFMGLDFDWEYPGAREGADPEDDKEAFTALVEELGKVLHDEGFLFTAAVSPGRKTIDTAYDIESISKVFDYINVMSYDYHGYFPDHNFTGVNAPLYPREEESPEEHPGHFLSLYYTINYYIARGAPKSKILMGVPFYGRGFHLLDKEENGLYCLTDAGIPKGPYTGQDGFWGYQEILQSLNGESLSELPDLDSPKGWTVVVDDCYKAPYAFNGRYWIGYDDVESMAVKAQFVNFLGIAGAFAWSVDTDDFLGMYSDEKYPLLTAINREFVAGTKLDPLNPKCTGTAPMCDTFDYEMDECDQVGEVEAYPGDCHKYYMCLANHETNTNEMTVFDCGNFVFDPNLSACTDPQLPGNDLLCHDG